MTFTVLGITITVQKAKTDSEIHWYPGAEHARAVDFYEQSKAKAAQLWSLYR